jgi:arsenite methyltransferase
MEQTELKDMVRQKYSEIALQDKRTNESSCCGATPSCCNEGIYTIMSDDYSALQGYQSDADLGLGCGLPTQFAHIRPGDTVVDLGSGAGNDCFVARHETGTNGKVIGIDFTPQMIEKARRNAEKMGFNNVEFRLGDIERIPMTSGVADVVVSNCVLNLVPDKQAVFSEIHRILKPGGHFSISDIVLIGELPDKLKSVAELYAGCVSGAIQKSEYLDFIRQAGFSEVTIQKEKPIVIPDEILLEYLTGDEVEMMKSNVPGVHSITVFAKKENCCQPGEGCC